MILWHGWSPAVSSGTKLIHLAPGQSPCHFDQLALLSKPVCIALIFILSPFTTLSCSLAFPSTPPLPSYLPASSLSSLVFFTSSFVVMISRTSQFQMVRRTNWCVMSVGGNAVSAFLSWRLQATNACDVTLVWKSGYETVAQYGISIK